MENSIDLRIGTNESSLFIEYAVQRDGKKVDQKRIEIAPSDVGRALISLGIFWVLTNRKSSNEVSSLITKIYEHSKKSL